jgi:hypothetical protein
MIRVVVAAVAVASGFAACSQRFQTASPPEIRGSCPVTIPSGTMRPRGNPFGPSHFNYGNRYLRAELRWPRSVLGAGILPDGGSMATINPGGSIRAKLGWWRGLGRKLIITGRRLDAPAPPLRAEVGGDGGARGFQASALIFPTVGCWRVVGHVRPVSLTFVVKVVRIRKR